MVYVKGFEESCAAFERALREGEQELDQRHFKIRLYNPETNDYDIEPKQQDTEYRSYVMQKLEILLNLAPITEFCKRRLMDEVETLYRGAHPLSFVIQSITENLDLFDPDKAERAERVLYNESRGWYNTIISRIGPNNNASAKLQKSLEEWENQINKNYPRN